MPESPRWLLSVGRKDLVMRILQDAARANRMALPASLDKQLQQVCAGDEGCGPSAAAWEPDGAARCAGTQHRRRRTAR